MQLFQLLTAVILLWAPPVQDSPCTLQFSGKVVDFHSQLHLSKAVLELYRPGSQELLQSVSTTDGGAFLLSELCPGKYTVVVSHPECRPITQEIVIRKNLSQTFVLEHHFEELKEVEVFGSKQKEETRSALERKLNEGILEQYSSGTLGEALKEITGVNTLNTGAQISKPSIHGLTGSRVLILNNGVRMQDMEWGDEHAPNVDINAVSNVTVVKGAASLRYGGDALGGIILLQPDQLKIDSPGLSGKALISMQSNGRGGTVSNRITQVFEKNWFAQVQGSYKILGDMEAPDYVLSNTGIRQGAAALRIGKQEIQQGITFDYKYFASSIGILRASHIGNVDDLIRSINSGQPEVIHPFTYEINTPRQRVTHHLGRIVYYKRFERVGRMDLSYDFQSNRRFEFDIRVGDDRNKPAIDLELTTHTIQADFKKDSNPNKLWEAGILGRYQENFPNPETGVRRLIPDYQRVEAGAYLTHVYRWKDKHSIDLGVRYDYSQIDAKKFYITSRWEERGYQEEFGDRIIEDLGTQLLVNPVLDYHNYSWSAGYQFKPDNDREFRLNFTCAQRAPNPSELFSDGLHHSAARIELGDLRIQSEQSKKLTASWQQSSSSWSWIIEPYINHVNDFILLEPTGVEFTIRGAFPVWSYRQTDALLAGLDLQIEKQWHPHWTSIHQFSYLYGQDQGQDIPLINMPPINTNHRLQFDLPQWHSFKFEVQGEYVFQQTRTPANIEVLSPNIQSNVLLRINDAPDAYVLLSAQASWQWPLAKGSVQLSLAGTNLLNTQFRNYLNRQRFFADDLGRNIQLQLKFNY